jgi:hypothetical protein
MHDSQFLDLSVYENLLNTEIDMMPSVGHMRESTRHHANPPQLTSPREAIPTHFKKLQFQKIKHFI